MTWYHRWDKCSSLSRFEEKIEMITESGCWIWMGASSRYGSFYLPEYPIKMAKGMVKAHAASLYLYKGIYCSPGQVILHKCDIPLCCNPYHLKIGTQLENIQDMATKRRYVIPGQILSDEQVDECILLRSSGESVKNIALKYGLSQAQMSRVTRGKTHQRRNITC